jgi:hypothetical protein
MLSLWTRYKPIVEIAPTYAKSIKSRFLRPVRSAMAPVNGNKKTCKTTESEST